MAFQPGDTANGHVLSAQMQWVPQLVHLNVDAMLDRGVAGGSSQPNPTDRLGFVVGSVLRDLTVAVNQLIDHVNVMDARLHALDGRLRAVERRIPPAGVPE